MSEVKVNCWFDEHSGAHVVAKSDHEVQRLRADTAEARVKTAEHDLEFFRAGKNEQFDRAEASEQRIAQHEGMLRHFANCADVRQVGTIAMDYVAALNPKPEAGSHEKH